MSSINNEVCPFCESGFLAEDIRDQKHQYLGLSLVIKQPGLYCNSCGESLLEPEHLKATRIELQAFRAKADG
jgi:HTH-type transcriptional regulator/antitoxin MqsA